jgi:transaldolase
MSEPLTPLHRTATTTRTDYWNDSCSIQELTCAIANGARKPMPS